MNLDEPAASAIQFSQPDVDAPGGPWQLAVVVTGEGFETRGLPLLAAVGSVMIEGIFPFPDGSGFSGYLAALPGDGDALSLGFAGLADTDLVFHPGDVA